MNKKLISVLALSALALTSCSTGVDDQEARIATIVTHTAESVDYSGSTPELRDWVEGMHQEWVEFYIPVEAGGSSYSIYVATEDGGGMEALNLEWYAPQAGEIEIKVKGNGWTEKDLSMVSGYVKTYFDQEGLEVDKITAFSSDGKTSSVAN